MKKYVLPIVVAAGVIIFVIAIGAGIGQYRQTEQIARATEVTPVVPQAKYDADTTAAAKRYTALQIQYGQSQTQVQTLTAQKAAACLRLTRAGIAIPECK